ncbi:MAG: hypothetical protein J7L82_03895 [Staphylothermus sp.]|nr:hypothetical protein [Staphylothermus sp.]
MKKEYQNIPRMRLNELENQINKYKWVNRLGVFLIMFPLSILLILYIYEYIEPTYRIDWLIITLPSLISSVIGYAVVNYSGQYVEKLRFIKFLINNMRSSYILTPVIYNEFFRKLAGFIVNNSVLCIIQHIERGKLTLGFTTIDSIEFFKDNKIMSNFTCFLKRNKISNKISEFRAKEAIAEIYEQSLDNSNIILARYYNLRYKKDLLVLIKKTLKFVLEKTNTTHFSYTA